MIDRVKGIDGLELQCTYLEQAVHHLQSTAIVVAMDKGRSPRGNEEVSFFRASARAFLCLSHVMLSQRSASPYLRQEESDKLDNTQAVA